MKGRGGAAQCYYEEKDSVRKGFYPLLRAGALAGGAGEEGCAGVASFPWRGRRQEVPAGFVRVYTY